MKAILLFVLGLALPAPSTPTEYGPLETFELALQADAIVDGVVTAFDESPPGETSDQSLGYPTFTIEVLELIHGTPQPKEMTVRAFVDWMCAARYAPYSRGQRAIFFLQYQQSDDGKPLVDQPLWVMGGGNDGECPVADDTVVHTSFMLEGLPRKRLTVFGHEYAGVVTPRDEFVAVIKGLRRRFYWPSEAARRSLPRSQWGARQVCSDADLATFKESSPFAEALIRDSEVYKKLFDRIR